MAMLVSLDVAAADVSEPPPDEPDVSEEPLLLVDEEEAPEPPDVVLEPVSAVVDAELLPPAAPPPIKDDTQTGRRLSYRDIWEHELKTDETSALLSSNQLRTSEL
jgi:hypothetical protein